MARRRQNNVGPVELPVALLDRRAPRRARVVAVTLLVIVVAAAAGVVVLRPSLVGLEQPRRAAAAVDHPHHRRSRRPSGTIETTRAKRSVPSSYEVGTRSFTWTEPSPASTENFAATPPTTTPGRILGIAVSYPSVHGGNGASPALAFGPYPVIVFAPGFDLTPASYAPLIDSWVTAGFVVVGITFPDTNPTAVAKVVAAGKPEDTSEIDDINQPHDVAYVVEQLAAEAASTGSFFHGLIDPDELALAGQSDGGNTVGALVYGTNPAYTVAALPVPIRAVAVLSGAELHPDAGYGDAPGPPPLLMVQSATDACNTPESAAALYDAIGDPSKFFLELDDADHLDPYTGGTDAGVVEAVTTAFFSMELEGRGSIAALERLGSIAGESSFTQSQQAPPMPDLADNPLSCYS